MKLPWNTESNRPLLYQIYQEEEAKNSEEIFLPGGSSLHDIEGRQQKYLTNKLIYALTILNIVIICCTMTILGVQTFRLYHPPSTVRNSALRELSYYSPVYDDIDIPIREIKINGTLFPLEDQAWSRLEPGNEIGEKQWESFEAWRPVVLTREQVLKLGKDPSTAARYVEGGYAAAGEDAYIGSPDIYHKVHCLNELRKNAFLAYNMSSTQTLPYHGRLWWIHLRHCTDIILQDLLCNANADMITYQWIETQKNPFPDFSINKKCRDISALESWQKEHTADVVWNKDLKKPEGVRGVPMEKGYFDLFPEEREEMDHHDHM